MIEAGRRGAGRVLREHKTGPDRPIYGFANPQWAFFLDHLAA